MVPGYILAQRHPGLESPFRSYFSAPSIDFGYKEPGSQVVGPDLTQDIDNNKFILSDIDSTKETLVRGQSSARLVETIENPFTGKDEVKFSKVLLRNQRAGETVARSRIVIDIDRQSD